MCQLKPLLRYYFDQISPRLQLAIPQKSIIFAIHCTHNSNSNRFIHNPKGQKNRRCRFIFCSLRCSLSGRGTVYVFGSADSQRRQSYLYNGRHSMLCNTGYKRHWIFISWWRNKSNINWINCSLGYIFLRVIFRFC